MLDKYNKAVDKTDITSNADPRCMINKLRLHLLFHEGVDLDSFGEEASLHYLNALSHLELACTSMKLFELKAENNG